ncbi:MAG: metallophosphoesterase [Eubacteriales bacterium]|nr:metallophosphoesterase [Eubacteriales bacterium]
MARYQYKYRKPQRRHFPVKAALLGLCVLLLLVYPFVEAGTLTIDRHTVSVTNLPSNLKNLKIAYVSDIHQCAWFSQQRVNDLIRTINGLSADIVIFGGDYAEDSDGAIAFFQNLPAVSARIGAYAIVGNHDRTEPEGNLSVLIGEIKGKGIIPLVNNIASIKLGDTYLYIAGVDDYYNGYPDVEGVAAQVSADDFVVFVGHSPDLMPSVLSARSKDGDNHWFDLALFGHTHGGQINLLGFSPFFNLRTEVGSRYLSGWLEENRAAVLVSNGVGTSVLPVRLLAPPQVHLITLKKR